MNALHYFNYLKWFYINWIKAENPYHIIGVFSNAKEFISVLVEQCGCLFPCPMPAVLFTPLEKQMHFMLWHQCAKQCLRYGANSLGHCYWGKTDKYLKQFLPARSNCTLCFWNNYSIMWFNEQTTKDNIKKSCFSSPFLEIRKET